jgi:hypothetical protein
MGMFYRTRPSATASADRAASSVTVEPMAVTAGQNQARCCSWKQNQRRCMADLCAEGELLMCSQRAGVLAEKVVHRRDARSYNCEEKRGEQSSDA